MAEEGYGGEVAGERYGGEAMISHADLERRWKNYKLRVMMVSVEGVSNSIGLTARAQFPCPFRSTLQPHHHNVQSILRKFSYNHALHQLQLTSPSSSTAPPPPPPTKTTSPTQNPSPAPLSSPQPSTPQPSSQPSATATKPSRTSAPNSVRGAKT